MAVQDKDYDRTKSGVVQRLESCEQEDPEAVEQPGPYWTQGRPRSSPRPLLDTGSLYARP